MISLSLWLTYHQTDVIDIWFDTDCSIEQGIILKKSFNCIFSLIIRNIKTMNINNVESYLRNNHDHNILLTYRTVKKFYLRVELVRLDIHFLKSCRTKDIIPKFLWFKTANRNLGSSATYKQCQRRLLNAEIDHKYQHLNKLKKMYRSSSTLLQQYCSGDLFERLQQIVTTICCPVIETKEQTVEKKFTVIIFVLNHNVSSTGKLSEIFRHEYYRMMRSIVLLMVSTMA